tara:strand:+ start:338 stop:544 length:207 start_codon:yes stop_codon:yes gene_type:complete
MKTKRDKISLGFCLREVETRDEALKAWDAGEQVFAWHEMDEKPACVTSLEMLNNYPADGLLVWERVYV